MEEEKAKRGRYEEGQENRILPIINVGVDAVGSCTIREKCSAVQSIIVRTITIIDTL